MINIRNKKTIGVVIPNRNDAKYLSKCIKSIISQKVYPDEVIILDDNSTDNSIEVIKNEIKNHHFFKLIKNKYQLGAIENSNKGLSLCTTDYVLFLGANDYIYSNFIKDFINTINYFNNDFGVFSGLINQVDERDKLIKKVNSPIISTKQIFLGSDKCIKYFNRLGSWLTGQSIVYKRSYLQEAGGFDVRMGGLNDLFSAVNLACTYGAIFVPKVFSAMRIHPHAFLEDTLLDHNKIKLIFKIIEAEGPIINSKIFNERLNKKIFKRIKSAVFNTALKNNRSFDYLISNKLILLILAYTPTKKIRFLIGTFYFRWFDLLPNIYYRIFKKFLIRQNRNYF